MTGSNRHPVLQIEQHLDFQRTMFRLRRVGVLVLLAGVLAALAGLLGGMGPFAEGHAESGPTSATWPRFTRYQMPTRLVFEADTAAITGSDTFDVVIEGDHARAFSFEEVLPQPREVAVADDRVRYTFKVEPGTRQQVLLQGQPETIGRLAGTASVAGGPPLRIDSFVYP